MKSGSWDMGLNALRQSDCRIFKLAISPEHKDEILPDFLHVDTNQWNLKVGWKILAWAWSNMGGLTTLTFAVSQKGINGINWFLVCW